MQKLSSNISIGSYNFDFVTEVEIDSGWEDFTDTCTITIPKALKFNSKPITNGENSIFNVGDRVSVKLGYDNILNEIFAGYVTSVDPSVPIKISCEDTMYIFKTISFSESFQEITLSDLLDFLLSKASDSPLFPSEGITLGEIPQMSLGKIRIKNATGAQVFDMLKKDYGLTTYFRNNRLWCGLAYYPDQAKNVSFNFERDIIQEDLTFKRETDIKIKLKVINVNSKTNVKTEYETGNADGEQRTFYTYDLPDSTLPKIANQQISNYRYTGFEGGFTTFGTPWCKQGDIVNLSSTKVPERNGQYYCKKVNTTFGMNGFRQNIEIDLRVQ